MKNIGKYVIGAVLCYMSFSFLGCTKDSFHFNDVPVSLGDTTTLSGIYNTEEGDSAYNSVFLDLSKNVQTTILRTSWDLGLYSGAANKVIINHSTGAAVIATDATDWTKVGQADSVKLTANNPDALLLYFKLPTVGVIPTSSAALTNVDPVAGDSTTYMGGTIVQLGKVYILNRGTMTNLVKRQWMKIKVTAITNGYSIEYGALVDQSSRIVQVIKDNSYNFNYISFTSSTVTVEPGKAYWDLEYTTTTYLNPTNNTLPMGTTDFVMINFVAGVTAAQVITTGTSMTFANFKLADIAANNITFSRTRDIIGTNWRTPATVSYLNINTDRFYLIKDLDGNVYKLSFAGGGSRGKPILQYINLYSAPAKHNR